jgi:hypothetical protein
MLNLDMPDCADARRRWFGLFFLVVAASLLIWGETILRPRLIGITFVLYWFVCFVMTALAIVVAILDMRATRRRIRDEQRALLERTWKDIDHRPEDWDKT